MAHHKGFKNPLADQFQFGPWKVTAVKNHILPSEGLERERFENSLLIPSVPEMIFADNKLRLEHAGGFGIEFNALDALKKVDPEHDTIKVAEAAEWQNARHDCEHITNVVKPFDWTFTTDYSGTLLGKESDVSVTSTEERIDVEKLKQHDKIHFYADIMLFEDELHDCGCSILNVKIRVMPKSFFLLLRLYMRVDDVIVRINDTRLYHEAEWDYLIQEYTSREKAIKDLKVEPHLISDASMISEHLDLKTEKYEKLQFTTKQPPDPDSTQHTSDNHTGESTVSSSADEVSSKEDHPSQPEINEAPR